MIARMILCFFVYSTFLIAITNNQVNINTIESKKKIFIYNENLMGILTKCANNNISSCNKLVNLGLLSKDECDPKDCHLIGALLSFVNRTNEAISYLKKSCESYDRLGCTHLAILYQENRDYKEAKYFYEISCNNGDAIGCYNLGMLYTSDKMSGKNSMFSTRFFKLACNMNYPKACFNLAVVYANHVKDLMNARYFFDKSCDYGIKDGCINADYLKSQGITMPILKKHRGLYIRPQ